ncbi:hypothetical protein STAQ_07080 [Allostella sp. ATCC 35155]|nr:hypothetical protein STAQ_07080 [Stella sp. ATCC 35155]
MPPRDGRGQSSPDTRAPTSLTLVTRSELSAKPARTDAAGRAVAGFAYGRAFQTPQGIGRLAGQVR